MSPIPAPRLSKNLDDARRRARVYWLALNEHVENAEECAEDLDIRDARLQLERARQYVYKLSRVLTIKE